MALIEVAWKPAPKDGFTFVEARMLAVRIGGPEVWDAQIKMGEDGLFHMEVATVNMAVRWMETNPAGFLREALSGVRRDALVRGPEFRVLIR